MNKNNDNPWLSIKVRDKVVCHLLAALELGIQAENWCDSISSASVCGGDAHSVRWISNIRALIKNIEKETGIKDRYYAHSGEAELEFISNLINQECAEIENEYEKHRMQGQE